MGIGRKEFLRLSGLALIGLVCDPLKAVAINEDAYVNKKLGILFHKPRDWKFVGVTDFGRLQSEQIIGEGLDMTTDEIWNDLGSPICVATKHYQQTPEYRGVFSPTITLNVTPKSELDTLDYETFEELMEAADYGISLVLKDYKLIKTYEPYNISNC